MQKPLLLISWMMILLLTIPVTPAQAASPPAAVDFEVPTIIPPDGTGPTYGPFTATGPAVDAGVICPTGQTSDVAVRAAGFQSGKITVLQIVKQFICDDGTGAFFVQLEVRLDRKGDNFNWVVIGGTESYKKLHGTGQGIGLPTEYGVLDLYQGVAHID